MKMGIDDYRNEFVGEIVKYCIDGDDIWFYDEISGGLFRLNKKSYSVELILTPMKIHFKKIFPIKQILKWKNKVYLIPNNMSHEWLVYNIVNKQLRSVLLSSQSYEIDIALNIGKWIYLIPEKTNHMVAIVEAETLSIKMITTNWFKKDFGELDCWGYSVFEEKILIPIIGSKEIFQIQGECIIDLSLHINLPIYSISLSKNGIWILPSEGNVILFVDQNGELIDSIEILVDGYKNSAEQFARIIALDKYVYLFPKRGGQMLVLEINNKKWIAIGDKDTCLYRPLLQKTESVSTYWGCYCNEGKLYTLPLKYRFAEINIENKLINYKFLRYANAMIRQLYMPLVYWLNGKAKVCFEDKGKKSLEDFCEIATGHNIAYSKEYIGKKLWMMVGKKLL